MTYIPHKGPIPEYRQLVTLPPVPPRNILDQNINQGSAKMRPTFLGIPDGGEKGYEFAFPFPCTCTRFAAKGVVFMDIIKKPFLLVIFCC